MPLALSCAAKAWGTWSAAPSLHIHFWIKRTGAVDGAPSIVRKYTTTSADGWAVIMNATTLSFYIWTHDETTILLTAAWTPDVGDWHCIDATFDGRYSFLYADNAEVDSDDEGAPDPLAAAAGDVYVSAADPYPGEIEGLAVWNAVLSAAQRGILWNSGRRIALAEVRLLPQTNLQAHLELHYDDRDYSVNKRNLSVLTSLTQAGRAWTRTIGQWGHYGAPYCPPLMPAHAAQRHCSHQDLAETVGH